MPLRQLKSLRYWKDYFWIFTRILTWITFVPTLIFCVLLFWAAQESRSDSSLELWRGVNTFDSSSESEIKSCLELGADINEQTYEGMTHLMQAAEANNLDYVRILVKLGADVNLRDNHGDTALTLANKAGNIEVAHFLQQHIIRLKEQAKL